MNPVRKKIGQCVIHPPMAIDTAQAAKVWRHDGQPVMACATGGARMSCMRGAVVGDVDELGIERGETRRELRFKIRHPGKTLRNGLTSTPA